MKSKYRQFIRILSPILCIILLISQAFSRGQQNDPSAVNYHDQKNIEATFGKLTPRASFTGVRSRERLAYSMSPAGDVNGDGYADFLLGTFHNGTRGSDAGAAYLILGRKSADWGMKFRASGADARFLGYHKYDAVGGCVGGPADVNGDGYADILIGAPAGNDLVSENPGELFIVFGQPDANWGDDCILAKSADVSLAGELAWDDSTYRGGLAGFSIGVIGDLNGDGCDEILVGAPFLEEYGKDAGKVYLIEGRKQGWPKKGKLNELAIATFGKCSGGHKARAGFAVSGVGDVNADGLPDFMIGAPGRSRAYLIYGRAQMNWGKNFDLANADVTFKGEGSGHKLGQQIEAAGDVNGDNIDDFIISAIACWHGGTRAGKVYLVLGRSGGWSSSEVNISSTVASFIGEENEDYAGWSISGIGDFDRDGYDDFIIGMFNDPDRSKPGKTYYIQGRAGGWQKNVSLSNVTTYFSGENDGDLCGFAVSAAGDINRDGLDDFLIASPYNSHSGTWRGQVYLFMNERSFYDISGQVTFYNTSKALSDVVVKLNGETALADTTDSNGCFKFQVQDKADYQLQADFANPPVPQFKTISPYDAALAARAALHLEQFTDLQKIAADVDGNGKLSMFDAALIFHFSLPYETTISSYVGQWQFTTGNLVYNNLSSDQLHQNFEGILLGDVDGSWLDSEALFGKLNDIPTRSPMEYQLKPNAEIRVPIQLPENEAFLSVEIKIDFDPMLVEFKRVEATPLAEKFQMAYSTKNYGQLHFGAFSTDYLNRGGKFVDLVFQSKSDNDLDISFYQRCFRINDQDWAANTSMSSTEEYHNEIGDYQLAQNYPNPFNPSTTIKFNLAGNEQVKLNIYNVLGQKVKTLINQYLKAGSHTIRWDRIDDSEVNVETGVYFYHFQAGNFTHIKKMVVLE